MKRKLNQERKKDIYSSSVADQPGSKIFFFGLLFSMIIGFSIRGVIAPERVKKLVEQAASQVHRDFHFQIDEAFIRLSRGGIPGIDLIVKRIHITSEKKCWMQPRIFIDEMRLPLPLWALITGRSPFKDIEVGEMHIQLGSERAECPAPEADKSRTSKIEIEKKPSIFEQRIQSGENGIESLSFQRLRVQREFIRGLEFDIQNVEIKKTTSANYHLAAKTQIFEDAADSILEIDYKRFPENQILMHLFGHWREGSYSFIARHDLDSPDFQADADVRYVPLSQLLKASKSDLFKGTPKQAWVSFQASVHGKLTEIENSEGNIRQLKIEGDMGELISSQILVDKIIPLKLKSFTVQVKNLSLDQLSEAGAIPPRPRTMSTLGLAEGTLQVDHLNQGDFQGKIQGPGFIFSHQGKREIQSIESLKFSANWNKEKTQVFVSEIKPLGGKLEGTLRYSSDRLKDQSEFYLNLSKLRLSDSVQGLYGKTGKVGDIDAFFRGKLVHSSHVGFEGTFSVKEFISQYSKFEDVKIKFNQKNKDIFAVARIKSLELLPSPLTEKYKVTSKILVQTLLSNAVLNQQLQFHQITAQGQLLTPEKGQFEVSGLDDSDKGFTADFQFKGLGRADRFHISGTRAEPVVTRVPVK